MADENNVSNVEDVGPAPTPPAPSTPPVNRRSRRSEFVDRIELMGLPLNTIDKLDLHAPVLDLPNQPTTEERNSYALEYASDYFKASHIVDSTLLEYYQEDFDNWTVNHFAELNANVKRALKRAIRAGGVYTGPNRGRSTTQQLHDLLVAEDVPVWPNDELRDQKELKEGSNALVQRQQLLGVTTGITASSDVPATPLPTDPTRRVLAPTVASTLPTIDERSDPRHITPASPLQQPSTETRPAIREQGPPDTMPYISRNQRQVPRFTEPTADVELPDDRESRYRTTTPFDPSFAARTITPNSVIHRSQTPGRELPPRWYANGPIDPQKLTAFEKSWNKEYSFGGDLYELLDDKVMQFYKKCRSLGIEPDQYHAVFPSILKDRASRFYVRSVPDDATFSETYAALKTEFHSPVMQRQYQNELNTLTFDKLKTSPEMADKTDIEVLDALFERLHICQRGMGEDSDQGLAMALIRACRQNRKFAPMMYKPAMTTHELRADLRSCIEAYDLHPLSAQYPVDRRYHDERTRRHAEKAKSPSNWKKKCYVCGKVGCFSTRHSEKEQDDARRRYLNERSKNGRKAYVSFLARHEGEPPDEESDDASAADRDLPDEEDIDTEDEAQGQIQVAYLTNQAFYHLIHHSDNEENDEEEDPERKPISPTQFQLGPCTRTTFQGIMPDTGAAEKSTAGRDQVEAFIRENPDAKIQWQRAGEFTMSFGPTKAMTSIGTISVMTPVGEVTFHVLPAPSPFLLCLSDMDRLDCFFDNTRNCLIQRTANGTVEIPIIRKFGHPWFHLGPEAATAFLTEAEMRRLHKRFGHPSVERLHRLLQRAGHDDVLYEALKDIQEHCHHCQMKGAAPKRFKFTLTEDHEFNYEIVVDVMQLAGRNVLHVVDAGTSFQAGRFLASNSAKDTWEALRLCWIDVYLGPPDQISHDAGTNFAAVEFQAEARVMGIHCRQIPVEAHWSIGKVERYHAPVRRAFEIIKAEMKGNASDDAALQMAFKAVNDTAGPNGLTPTLLVFGAFPRLTAESPPSPTTLQRIQAITKARAELRKLVAKRKVNDALNTRNGPDVQALLPSALPLGSEVAVWREGKGWDGPRIVTNVTDTEITVDSPNGPVVFRNTHVKPYRRKEEDINPEVTSQEEEPEPFEYPPAPQPRRRGRPPKEPQGDSITVATFLTQKERSDKAVALDLRNRGIITTPGAPFEESDALELDTLLGNGVLKPERLDRIIHGGIRIFKSRMVREVKNKTTPLPYEKSRLVVQGYADEEKRSILTQAPTIQRCSQRLLLALVPTLRQLGMRVMIRDITQAYVQSKSTLSRTILISLPHELKKRYPEGTILRVMKPLYGIAEAGAHWFATYQAHHMENMGMTTSCYDPCLLISKDAPFGIVGLQTDDTLNIGTDEFVALEAKELEKAKFKAKPPKLLGDGDISDFNGCRIQMESEAITVTQKGQAVKLALVDPSAANRGVQYVEQRARGAYIASLCQPEAAFNYAIAAQAQDPDVKDINALNKQIQWQMDNAERGLRYVSVDLTKAKLMVFADGSFANNKDLTSQIGFVMTLVNEEVNGDKNFTIMGNILHWTSVKCKRVTRSVLASEIYGLVAGFDIGYVVDITLNTIAAKLGMPDIPIVVCTDSFSLYECLVKLGTTNEKRLMIDIMALRQSYERREIHEIRWIAGTDNPADAMTKAEPNSALQRLVSTNALTIRLEGWVQRETS